MELSLIFYFLFISISQLIDKSKVRSESFTALADIKTNFQKRDILINKIQQFIDLETQKLSTLRQIVESSSFLWNKSIDTHKLSGDSSLADPLFAYTIVKQSNTGYTKLLEHIDNLKYGSDEIDANENDAMAMADNEDYMGAIDGILRLQETYKIPAYDIANGVVYKDTVLSKEDCFKIGVRSMSYDYFVFLDWMGVVYQKGLKTPLFFDYYSYALYQLKKSTLGLALSNEWVKVTGGQEKALEYQDFFKDMSQTRIYTMGDYKGDLESIDDISRESLIPYDAFRGVEFKTYESLCRIDNSKVVQTRYKKCRYYRPHPYFLLAPVKMEIMYRSPRIVMYHNLISDAEMDHIKKLATPKLNRATVQNPLTGKLEFATYRISKSAWLKTYDSEVTERLNRRINLLTNINLETAEELQVVNYGIGGHYEPHYDFARKRETNSFEPEIGNRLATLIFYMSNIEAGGGTVFTDLGIKLEPVKGSAAFWWNLYRNGDGDLRTRHAACPVLSGSKWVMNKWFHERSNEFTRPCHLNKHL